MTQIDVACKKWCLWAGLCWCHHDYCFLSCVHYKNYSPVVQPLMCIEAVLLFLDEYLVGM